MSNSQKPTRRPGLGTYVVAVLLATGGVVLFCFDPSQGGAYPVCLFHRATGLLCPGCGGLRALHQLLHGHLVAAFRFNSLLMLCLPFGLWFAGRYASRKLRREPADLGFRPLWVWVFLTAALVLSVWRNLPGAPLALRPP